jgi:alpha-L-fucosidase
MKLSAYKIVWLLLLTGFLQNATAQKNYMQETKQERDKRMQWWHEARFGMFIHWGLYSIPAGEWKGATNHAEWIRTTAQIPLDEYNKFVSQFNPIRFNADEWVAMAKNAGMKYITITSKHHDGFCLWDSKQTDFDVMSTPFHRDILKELAAAVRKAGGIKLCFYHSIMDWHHPDYTQRRDWEKDRGIEGADRKRYITYLKNELKELLTNYGDIGVIWFDGEWENFWTHEDGKDLYNYVRSLKPNVIINNRVDKGRSGMQGMTTEGDFAGDFGTPEQEIPETGLPGVYWESCMTMNNNWGYNSDKELIQKLADIASKGGNFLLNIGPKPDGTFPQESIDRLASIGPWMKTNGESIYGTQASPFEHISWGRVTQKPIGADTRLYLHVFDWPQDGKIVLHGIENKPIRAFLLSDPHGKIKIERDGDALVLQAPADMPDTMNTVIALDIKGKAFTHKDPVIHAFSDQFIQSVPITIEKASDNNNVAVRYTLDGTDPDIHSALYTKPIILNKNLTIKARSFFGTKPVSGIAVRNFEKVSTIQSMDLANALPGLKVSYYKGEWDMVPDFKSMSTEKTGFLDKINTGIMSGEEHYGLSIEGYIKVPADDVYTFYLSSDDGSKLYIDGKPMIDNDGLHGMNEKTAATGLGKGYHRLHIDYFEKTGGDDLSLEIESMNMKKQPVKNTMLFHN